MGTLLGPGASGRDVSGDRMGAPDSSTLRFQLSDVRSRLAHRGDLEQFWGAHAPAKAHTPRWLVEVGGK